MEVKNKKLFNLILETVNVTPEEVHHIDAQDTQAGSKVYVVYKKNNKGHYTYFCQVTAIMLLEYIIIYKL